MVGAGLVVGGAVVGAAVVGAGLVVGGAVVGAAVVGAGLVVGAGFVVVGSGLVVAGGLVLVVGGEVARAGPGLAVTTDGEAPGETVGAARRPKRLGAPARRRAVVTVGFGAAVPFGAVGEVADSPFTTMGGCGRVPGVVELVAARCGRVVAVPRPLWIEGFEAGCEAYTRMTAAPTARNAKNAMTTIRRSVTGFPSRRGARASPDCPGRRRAPLAPWGGAGDCGPARAPSCPGARSATNP